MDELHDDPSDLFCVSVHKVSDLDPAAMSAPDDEIEMFVFGATEDGVCRISVSEARDIPQALSDSTARTPGVERAHRLCRFGYGRKTLRPTDGLIELRNGGEFLDEFAYCAGT